MIHVLLQKSNTKVDIPYRTYRENNYALIITLISLAGKETSQV